MMFRAKRSLIMTLSVLLAMSFSVFGTLAFLTDTDAVVNTFTVGNVDITVNEAEVNTNGELTGSDLRVEGNEYHLIPGKTYIKDPTMTVHAGSESSYVRMLVTLNKLSEIKAIPSLGGENFLPENFVSGWDREVWVPYGITEDTEANTVTYEFRYFETVDTSEMEEDLVLDALFDSLTIPGEITGDELATIVDLEITINGHAIQSQGFDDADAAWAAFDAQAATAEDTGS